MQRPHCQRLRKENVRVLRRERVVSVARTMDASVTMSATIVLVVDVQQTPRMRGNRIGSNVRRVHVGVVRGNCVGGTLRALDALLVMVATTVFPTLRAVTAAESVDQVMGRTNGGVPRRSSTLWNMLEALCVAITIAGGVQSTQQQQGTRNTMPEIHVANRQMCLHG